jgi:sugar transferase (PEP-CTERM/EpsH1 system associated)
MALRVLFLAPRVPWPLDTGGKIRTHYLMRALARRHRVRVLALGDPNTDGEGAEAVREMGAICELHRPAARLGQLVQLARGLAGPVPYNIRKYGSSTLEQRARQLARQGEVDVVHCDHVHMAPYGPSTGLPYVVDEHNVETVIWERFARDPEEPLYKRALFRQQAFWLRRAERRLCREASLVLLCSQTDEQALRELVGPGRAPRTVVVPNGVDVGFFAAPGPAADAGHVFFTGSMDWAPNENAVLTFVDEIYPEMQRELPGLRFYVVGRNPGARLRERHGAAGVHVTGTVPDVRPYMRGALALLVPMRVGGGTRLKILEAFAAGVPVISTAIGIEGIAAEPGVHYLRAETAAEFAAGARRLREEPRLREALVQAGGALAQGTYSWDAVGEALARTYDELFGSGS